MQRNRSIPGILIALAGSLGTLPLQAGFVLNPSFEANYNDVFPHYGGIDMWVGGSGVNQSDGPFHNGGTPIPDGTRVGFKQGSGDLSQDITGLTPGKRYVVQFYYDARGCCGGTIDLSTKINGTELDKVPNVQPVTGGGPYKLRTVPFTAEGDTVTLTFTASSVGDATVNIDAVSVTQRDTGQLNLANPSFEASGDVADSGLLTPNPLAGWTAEGQYGVNLSGSGPIADNGTAPDQDHVAFIQGAGSIRQIVPVLAGKPYQLTVAYNATTGTSPHFQIKVGDTVLFEEDVTPVGGAAAYKTKTVSFTSTDVTATITLAQTKDGNHNLLMDDVRLAGEVPPDISPIALVPEVAELAVNEAIDVTVQVPSEVLALRALDLILQTSTPGIARFADVSSALVNVTTVHFDKGAPNQSVVKIQGLAKGTGTIQVLDAAGLPVKNQIAVTVTGALLKNPSFESTTRPIGGVGYTAIAGWAGGSGINDSTGPFQDNGIIPDRRQVGFAQGTAVLSQSVHGLVPGKNYWLQFFYNIRNCCPADGATLDLAVTLGGKTLANLTGITAVGEGLPYNFHHVEFVADSVDALLEFKPTPTGDATLLLDSISIVQRDPGQVVVRNPSFEASGSVFTFPGYFDSVGGWEVSGGGRGVNIDGAGPFTDNGRANAGDLVLFLQGNGSSVSQNLTGLTDGREYLVGFLLNARVCCGPEESSFSVSFADAPLLEESFAPAGGANAYLVRQATFTAAGTEGTLKFSGTTPSGDHTILIDNVVVLPASGTKPFVLSQPSAATAASGGTVMLFTAAIGGGTLNYLWKKDGQPLANQSEPILTLENVTPANAGDYTVEVRNSSGTVTSLVARVTVLETVPGLYDTGVGNDRAVLADGATDPHYTLVTNPDNPQSTAALVQDSSLWPIVAGPWFANSDASKWIGPRVNPGVEDPLSGPAGGNYIYRLNVDLTGFDPATVMLSGNWGADNSADLIVNGVATGLARAGFDQLTAFTATRVFKAGMNQIDFRVNNGDPTGGPTGLRLEGLTAVGAKGGTVASPSLAITRSGQNLRLAWPTSATGFVLQSTPALPGGWANDPAPVVVEGISNVVFLNPGAGAQFYRLRQ